MRLYRAAFLAAVLAACVPSVARAAELRISLAELAGVVHRVLGDSKLHLHNKPGGFLSATAGSTWTIAGTALPVPLPPKSFPLLGSTYAYYVDDLNSTAITVSAAPSAVRLTLAFEDKAAALSGGCISGACGLVNALPKIVWKNGTVTLDVVPVRHDTSVALQVKSVAIGGSMSATCGGAGVFADSGCSLALAFAKKTIANLKPQMAAAMKTKVNEPATQDAIATGLKTYLAIGPAGEITITDVISDAKTVRIVFQLPGAAGG